MAGAIIKDWNDAKAQAQKILGKEGELPKPRTDIETVMNAANKAIAELGTACKAFESKVDGVEDSLSKVKNAANQYDSMISGATFGLDPKKPDQKKQIADAQKILSASLQKVATAADGFTKVFADLEKTIDTLNARMKEVG